MSAEYVFTEVHTHQLIFDPENPRLPPDVPGDDDDAVVMWMLSDTGLIELMSSIARQGYFPGDPLLIAPKRETGRPPAYSPRVTYKVVEGNRRLVALKLLTGALSAPRRQRAVAQLIDEADTQDLETVPAVVFARRADVLDYLGFRHITGVKEWDPLEKARFLRQLRDRAENGDRPSNTDLARAIGSKGPYVGRLLAALSALELMADSTALAKSELTIDDVPFSLLVAAFNHEPIVRTFLELDRADDPELSGLNRRALTKLGRWLFVKRKDTGRTALEDSRNLGLLDDVVRSRDAIRALDAGMSIRDAALLAHGPTDVVLGALAEAHGPLKIANNQADDLEEATDDLVRAADEARDLTADLAEKVHAAIVD